MSLKIPIFLVVFALTTTARPVEEPTAEQLKQGRYAEIVRNFFMRFKELVVEMVKNFTEAGGRVKVKTEISTELEKLNPEIVEQLKQFENLELPPTMNVTHFEMSWNAKDADFLNLLRS
ncbi:unnamed protein product [Bursaphelenchus xylophilus]|uniref:(pine wood nematode) hypothetical protein n=1 Tax=Bursaphelenchus xylophilus TaxID=6326 RepID=A0A1I7SAI8_BURXY|nr:unnamed protein product [Bursaphelenchus xylophilus]CAG9079362.1 unnamed protein product [Bursaphelenchus xylophilus]